jgi:uncharacterized protein with HEPN domain
MWRDDASLLDMLIWARRAVEFTAPLTEVAFAADRLTQSATVRCLEVIGATASPMSTVTWISPRCGALPHATARS